MFENLKSAVKNLPVIGPNLVRLRNGGPVPRATAVEEPLPFHGSADYWERRYAVGDNSGAGSYGRLATFKANFLNRFVKEHGVASVIEFGSGDGAQLKLARYPKYTGVDVSTKAVELCRNQFASDKTKAFLHTSEVPADLAADLTLSLDVVYHLVEDSVFEAYMGQLFRAARKYVIVYSSNMDQSWPNQHVRHRNFTKWVAANEPAWSLQSVMKNRYPYDPQDPERTSFADFHVFARARKRGDM